MRRETSRVHVLTDRAAMNLHVAGNRTCDLQIQYKSKLNKLTFHLNDSKDFISDFKVFSKFWMVIQVAKGYFYCLCCLRMWHLNAFKLTDFRGQNVHGKTFPSCLWIILWLLNAFIFLYDWPHFSQMTLAVTVAVALVQCLSR